MVLEYMYTYKKVIQTNDDKKYFRFFYFFEMKLNLKIKGKKMKWEESSDISEENYRE